MSPCGDMSSPNFHGGRKIAQPGHCRINQACRSTEVSYSATPLVPQTFPKPRINRGFFFSTKRAGKRSLGVLTTIRSTWEGTMFADSLLDNNWDNRSHWGWTTLASFALQAL